MALIYMKKTLHSISVTTLIFQTFKARGQNTISYNLFAGTEMLSLFVYEPIAIQILLGGQSPNSPNTIAFLSKAFIENQVKTV